MSETRSDMIVLPPDGIWRDHYLVLHNWNRYARGADETESWGWGFLPGEVTVDGRVIRFWLLPNGKLDARNRYRILGRYPLATPGGWVDWGFANRLERALEEKYGDNDYPHPTVLSSTTAAIRIEDDPDGGVRYIREERTL